MHAMFEEQGQDGTLGFSKKGGPGWRGEWEL